MNLKSGLEVNRSLTVIETGAIRKLGAVSYSPSIVTITLSIAVCASASKYGESLKTGLVFVIRSRSL